MGRGLVELRAEIEDLRAQLAKEQENHRRELEALQQEVAYWKDKLFGRRSEKYGEFERTQMLLFNEAEDGAIGALSAEQRASYRVPVRTHQRVKRGVRKPLPASLPRVEVIHDIPEEQKVCSRGRRRVRIGEEFREELEYKPAELYVLRHVRPKYACVRDCPEDCPASGGEEPRIRIAAPPPSMIPKGMAAPGFLTQVVVSKFVDAIPFYRQVVILKRMGIELHRSLLCSWTMEVAGRLEVLKTLLWEKVLSGPLIQADETKLQVLEEPGRENRTKSWMWVYRGGELAHPVVVFEYDPSRAGRVPMESLGGYRGYLQTDGYKGYDAIGNREGIKHQGCLAHIRRKFEEARRVGGENGQAEKAMEYIREVYAVESQADAMKLSAQERKDLRLKESKPVLDEFRTWLQSKSQTVYPSGYLGKAIEYAIGQWDRMMRYLEDGILRPDNNLAENAIRPFCVGRKNWLFAGSPRGAFASATIFTLIETAKANGLEPYHYMHHVFRRLPLVMTEADLLALLPTSLTPAQIAPSSQPVVA